MPKLHPLGQFGLCKQHSVAGIWRGVSEPLRQSCRTTLTQSGKDSHPRFLISGGVRWDPVGSGGCPCLDAMMGGGWLQCATTPPTRTGAKMQAGGVFLFPNADLNGLRRAQAVSSESKVGLEESVAIPFCHSEKQCGVCK
eukprot:EG_transcript_44732